MSPRSTGRRTCAMHGEGLARGHHCSLPRGSTATPAGHCAGAARHFPGLLGALDRRLAVLCHRRPQRAAPYASPIRLRTTPCRSRPPPTWPSPPGRARPSVAAHPARRSSSAQVGARSFRVPTPPPCNPRNGPKCMSAKRYYKTYDRDLHRVVAYPTPKRQAFTLLILLAMSPAARLSDSGTHAA